MERQKFHFQFLLHPLPVKEWLIQKEKLPLQKVRLKPLSPLHNHYAISADRVLACEKLGTVMVCSTIATTSLEDIAKSAPNCHKWFQLYIYRDREETKRLVERAGFEALVLTVDTPLVGKRRDDLRNEYSLPSHLR